MNNNSNQLIAVPQRQLEIKFKNQTDIVVLLLLINKNFLTNIILIPSFFKLTGTLVVGWFCDLRHKDTDKRAQDIRAQVHKGTRT